MITNLCFHGIGVCEREREPGESRYWVSAGVFHGILDVAREYPQVRLSFDDGNKSDIETALPALADRDLGATFFALAGRLDDPVSLSPSDLRELRVAGMTIGSHGWAHVPWRGLSQAEVRREVVDARRALSDASAGPVDIAAFPLGRYDRRILGELKRAGYRTVFTSDRFPARPGSWLQARYSITATDTPDTVRALLDARPGLHELRNLAASVVKRLR